MRGQRYVGNRGGGGAGLVQEGGEVPSGPDSFATSDSGPIDSCQAFLPSRTAVQLT